MQEPCQPARTGSARLAQNLQEKKKKRFAVDRWQITCYKITMLNTDRLSLLGPGFNWFRVAFFYSRANVMTERTEWFMLDAMRIALDNMLKG